MSWDGHRCAVEVHLLERHIDDFGGNGASTHVDRLAVVVAAALRSS